MLARLRTYASFVRFSHSVFALPFAFDWVGQRLNVAVFFITGRRDSQRDATLLNLDHAGFQGWTRLVTRPDSDTNRSIVPFKSGERAKIQAAGYTIIATIGDQDSDRAGGFAECGFKLPNPFYFIE